MLSAKENFFREHLLPLGQLVTIVHAIPTACQLPAASRFNKMRQDAQCQTILDALSLVSCMVIHPNTRNFEDVAAAVRVISSQLVALMDATNPHRRAVIAKVFGDARKLSPAARNAGVELWAQYHEQLPTYVAALHSALDYTPAGRTAWLSMYTRDATPLTKGRRINRWRSLAMSTSWDLCLAKLQASGVLRPFTLDGEPNVFTSRVSMKHAAALWQETFPNEEAASAPGKAAELVPSGVTVQSTPQGWLEVKAVFEPIKALSVAHQRRLAAEPAMSKELKSQLAPQVFMQEASLTQLGTAVAAAEQWLLQQASAIEPLTRLLVDAEKAQRVAQLKAKLKTTFSAQELELLAEVVQSTVK